MKHFCKRNGSSNYPPLLRNLCKTAHCEERIVEAAKRRSGEAIFKWLILKVKIASLRFQALQGPQ